MKRYIETVRALFSIANDKPLMVAELLIGDLLFNLVDLLPPIATAGIIAVVTTGEISGIWFYVFLYIFFYALYFSIKAFNNHIYTKLHGYYYLTVQQKLFEHVAENETIFDKISHGHIMDTCSDDVRYLVDVVEAASEASTGVVQLVVIFSIFSYYNIFVAFLALAIDLLYIILVSRNSRQIARRYEGVRKYEDKIIDTLTQMLNNLKQVKSLNMVGGLTKKLTTTRHNWEEQYDSYRHHLKIRQSVMPITVYLGKILLYIFLAYLVVDGAMTIDKLVLLISYFELVITYTDEVLTNTLDLSKYGVRVNRVKTILSYTGEGNIDYGDIDNDYINGMVVFDRVNYSFKNKPVLQNISFKAHPNKITAIIGKPGSGKTTIINLLYRLYHVKSGSILIDDESIYNYSKKVYSSNVSGVFQKPFAFKMSIAENLSLVDPSRAHQIEACKRVGVHNAIEALPKGYNTIIDADQPLLTDGEIQKIALARALLSRAEILLLDEVTSNIDPASTADVIKILQDLKDDHTIILVTHKAELMDIADQIVVLNNGKVSAKGDNKEVYKKSKLYKELHSLTFTGPSALDDD